MRLTERLTGCLVQPLGWREGASEGAREGESEGGREINQHVYSNCCML